jgi:hypothetical protein
MLKNEAGIGGMDMVGLLLAAFIAVLLPDQPHRGGAGIYMKSKRKCTAREIDHRILRRSRAQVSETGVVI